MSRQNPQIRNQSQLMSTKSSELYHFGVKGMKWGVRKRSVSSDTPSTHKVDPRTLSDKDLQANIKRMQLEKQYSDLSKQTNTLGMGQRYTSAFLKGSGNLGMGIVKGAIAGVFTAALTAQIKKRTGL